MSREWLIELRKENKLIQLDIAKRIKVSESYYSQIENGKRNPSVSIAKALGQLLNFEWRKFYED